MSTGRLKATFNRIRESIEITLDHKHINIFKEHEEKATRKKVDHLTFRQKIWPFIQPSASNQSSTLKIILRATASTRAFIINRSQSLRSNEILSSSFHVFSYHLNLSSVLPIHH
ncbi:hypothetical protein I312_103132 [Cryptococcus bacillisporus CA1280]|uniref:uncharacterized protein n=1 Tax=Cryptococcus bacillisporus CA1280 TaxID=1296109 RepID=UPI0033672F42